MNFIFFITFFFFVIQCHSKSANNVLLIVVDDLKPSIGAYGDPNAVTPNIDQMAKDGITFHNAFAQQALCAPSRNSFLTSRRPDTLHLYDFYSYWRDFAGNFTTLPQYFKENFYYTKSIGKIFHPGVSSNFTDDYPLSWSVPAWHPETERYKNAAVCTTKKGSFSNLYCPVNVSEQPMGTLPDIESVKEAKNFLKSAHKLNKPFFLAVGFHKPHAPFKFPENFANFHPIENISLPNLKTYPPGLPTVAWNPWNDVRWRHDIAELNISYPYQSLTDEWIKKLRQGYFASVSYVDSLLGELLHALKASNLHKSTIVVLLGDHGWSLGEHGEWSKYSNFDVAVRVPLIFRIPDITYFTNKKNTKNKGVVVEDLVELVDMFPTLVDLVKLKSIPKCPEKSSRLKLCTEGRSLKSLIKRSINERGSSSLSSSSLALTPKNIDWDNYALSQYPRPGIHPTKKPDSDEPKLNQIRFMGYSIRTPRYRYTQWIPWDLKSLKGNWSKVNQTEFYDHHIDPNENLNLAGRPGLEDIEEKLKGLLRKGFGIKELN